MFDVLHQRRTRAALELCYSALEVKYYVFGLKCPWPPRLARPPSATPQANAGQAWLAGELVPESL